MKLSDWQWYVLPLLSFIIWLPSLNGSFQFDDYNVIVDVDAVHSLNAWWSALPSIRPLLKLSYTSNWLISHSAFDFHVVNVGIHVINGILFYLLLKKHLPVSPLFSLLISVLWLLHPVNTEAVSYISGRSVSFSTTFLLLGLLALHHHEGRHLAAIATLCALLIRETAWIFPVVYALILWLEGYSWQNLIAKITPSLVVVFLAFGYFIYHPYYHYLLQTSFATRTLSTQIISQIAAYDYFFRYPILQLNPNIDPDIAETHQLNLLLACEACLLIGVFMGALFRVIRRRCWLAGGIVWFFILLAPTNSIVPRFDLANDRHLYAPIMGFAWLTAIALLRLKHGQFAIYVLLIILSIATLIREQDYQSELALWARTSTQSPYKSRVWNNLGIACQQQHQLNCAEIAFKRAVGLDKNNITAGNNLYFLQQHQQDYQIKTQ